MNGSTQGRHGTEDKADSGAAYSSVSKAGRATSLHCRLRSVSVQRAGPALAVGSRAWLTEQDRTAHPVEDLDTAVGGGIASFFEVRHTADPSPGRTFMEFGNWAAAPCKYIAACPPCSSRTEHQSVTMFS